MDKGHQYTAKELTKLEKKIKREYEAARKTVKKRCSESYAKYHDAISKKWAEYKGGAITITEYKEFKQKVGIQYERDQGLLDALVSDLSNADKIAMRITGDYTAAAYLENFNFGTYEIESGYHVNTSFTLYDKHTVQNLLRGDDSIIPKPKLDIPKDQRWNRQKLTSELTQGILAGDSIPDIAKRFQRVADMDEVAALRNARTYMTAAENKGRLDSYYRAQDLGLAVKKQWLATIDNVTRDSHVDVDGEIVKIDETFSNGLDYPGAPGPPEEVYNCRCTMVAVLDKYEHLHDDWRHERMPDGIDYDEWKYSNGEKAAKIADLKDQISAFEDNISALLPSEKYIGIWKDEVTLADYEAKKDSIQKKYDYYSQKLDELAKQGLGVGDAKYDEMFNHMLDLQAYELKGKQYAELSKELKQAQKELDALTKPKAVAGKGPFTPDMYTQEAKNAAKSFTDRYAADKWHRKYLDSIWNDLTDEQKYALWEYTSGSGGLNRPLSGYQGSWRNFVGVGKVSWDYESGGYLADLFKNFGDNGEVSYFNAIKELTLGIEKSELQGAAWFVRGSDINGLAGLFRDGFSGLDYDTMERLLNNGDVEAVRALVLDNDFVMHSFTSTGMAKGTGFGGSVKYEIYAPQGTKCIYAEPQSYFGDTISGAQFYEVGMPYNYVGGEAEVLFQRGTTYRIRDINYEYGSWTVQMDVVDQPKYFKFGDEETITGGATRHEKSKKVLTYNP